MAGSETTELNFHTDTTAAAEANLQPWSYRDSVRSISVSGPGGLTGWSLQVTGSNSSSSSSSGTSSVASDSSGTSSVASDSSYDSTSGFSQLDTGFWAGELGEIAHRMVLDRYVVTMFQSVGSPEGAMVRWFSELRVEWVLSIKENGRLPRKMREFQYSVGGVGPSSRSHGALYQRIYANSIVAQNAKTAMLKMLPFVDFLAAVAVNDDTAPKQLRKMLLVHACLSDALFLPTDALNSTEIQAVFVEMSRDFSAKAELLSGAIWSMMEQVKSWILENDWSDVSEGGSAVHMATRLMMDYIKLLGSNSISVASILRKHYSFGSLIILTLRMTSDLHDVLTNKSQSISDPGLRCLFLLNNSNFIAQRLESQFFLHLPEFISYHKDKIESYVQSYLQVSWAPVLSCLSHAAAATNLCLWRGSSPAGKFESEFERTYSAHKLFTVPSPVLRERLREAVIARVVPGYCNFLQELPDWEKNTNPPRWSPRDMEDMLEELFEGFLQDDGIFPWQPS